VHSIASWALYNHIHIVPIGSRLERCHLKKAYPNRPPIFSNLKYTILSRTSTSIIQSKSIDLSRVCQARQGNWFAASNRFVIFIFGLWSCHELLRPQLHSSVIFLVESAEMLLLGKVHEIAEKFKLAHISRGEGAGRYLVLMKSHPSGASLSDPSTWSITLRKRWVKDFSLPITIFQSCVLIHAQYSLMTWSVTCLWWHYCCWSIFRPYFEYFVDLYEKDFKSKTKLGYLLNAINELGSEAAFWAYQSKVRLYLRYPPNAKRPKPDLARFQLM
jgi:hypothetical protein